jgi:transposase-like protein
MTIRPELLDELLKDYETPQDILGEGGLLKELTKAVIERCLKTELDTHPGYPKYRRKGNANGNTRNGHSQKTLKGEQGHVDIEVPRDRQGSFEPQLVKKGQTRLEGFDDKILALGVNLEGQKELLGMWLAQTEGARFWLSVLTELQNRGVKDIFIACVDGLTGLPEAIETVYPQTRVQLCMVHLMRNSLRYVSHKHMKAVATDLKAIYSASTEAEAEFNLELFAEKWDALYPSISKSWRAHWSRVIPLFAFPEDIRKVIYTTNAIESVNMTLRKVTRNHRIFPSDEAVYKVVYLAMCNIAKKWTMPIRDWKPALNRLAIEFEGRFPH